jgi:methionyl-tRNA formyltransferase
MGRDEFSCLVLQELFQAKGELMSTYLDRHCIKPYLFCIPDVWDDIVIATQPDAHVGRRGSVLSICEFSPLLTLGPAVKARMSKRRPSI